MVKVNENVSERTVHFPASIFMCLVISVHIKTPEGAFIFDLMEEIANAAAAGACLSRAASDKLIRTQ